MESPESKSQAGRYTPTLILHGGAGAIRRSHLPPSLYVQYHRSLLHYLTSTKSLLNDGATALDAAVHAVSLMEDDELFNCGHGSVFNLKGEIEMEASVMIASVHSEEDYGIQYGVGESSKETGSGMAKQIGGLRKRAAAVSLVQQTRHPIQLAREVLLEGDAQNGEVSSMHCHLSGRDVEEWGWGKGLEKKPKEWFWTRRRWEEHNKGLNRGCGEKARTEEDNADGMVLPSQGTVGAVCLDKWGNVAVATSTGGLTNKRPGRIGDTPTVGAGFWAESWEQRGHCKSWAERMLSEKSGILKSFRDCLSPIFTPSNAVYQPLPQSSYAFTDAMPEIRQPRPASHAPTPHSLASRPESRRAIAMSGTGNGDSFLRTNAARSAGARCRYGERATALSNAVTAIAGPGGELQRSAGSRFGFTGEGEGGIIGIEVFSNGSANVVFDFNCGGMWRAWYEDVDRRQCPKVMVFRDEYR